MSTTTPNSSQSLSLDQIRHILGTKHLQLTQSIRDGIKYKLKKNIEVDTVSELLNEISINILLRAADHRVQFESEAKLVGYVLKGCWNNYRDSQVRRIDTRSVIYYRDQQREDDVFLSESYQTYPYSNHSSRSKKMEVSIEDFITDADANSDSAYDRFQEPQDDQDYSDSNHPEFTDQDITDQHFQQLYQLVMTYLEDCIADGFFTFKEVGIYKQYLINGYTLKQLIAESDFSRTVCTEAVFKIKQHLQTVDWRLNTRFPR